MWTRDFVSYDKVAPLSAIGWNLLVDCYRYGYGVRPDSNQAAYNYMQATKANIGMRAKSQAHLSLGHMYEKGEGLPKLEDKACFHFMFAADRYNHDAQMKVAFVFEAGNGANFNLDRAVMYFKLAARGGNAKAHLKVQEYLVLGHGMEHARKLPDKIIEEGTEEEMRTQETAF